MHTQLCFKLLSLSILGTLAALSFVTQKVHADDKHPIGPIATSTSNSVSLAAWQGMLGLAFKYKSDAGKIILKIDSALSELSVISDRSQTDAHRYSKAMEGLEKLETLLIANVKIVPPPTFLILRNRITLHRENLIRFKKESDLAQGKLAPTRAHEILKDTLFQVDQARFMNSAAKGEFHAN